MCLTYCTLHNVLEVHPTSSINGRISFLLVAESCCIMWMDHLLFIHPSIDPSIHRSIDEQLGSFQVLAAMNHAAVHMGVQICLRSYYHFLWGPAVESLGHRKLYFEFFEEPPYCFQSGCSSSHAHPQGMRVRLFATPLPTLFTPSVCLMTGILPSVRSCLTVISILPARTEGEGPTARLQPRLPDDVAQGKLGGHRAQGLSVLLHGLTHPCYYHVVQRFRARGQGPSLGRVPGELEEQGRAVLGHTITRAGAHASAIAGPCTLGVEPWSHVVDLPESSTVLFMPACRVEILSTVMKQELMC